MSNGNQVIAPQGWGPLRSQGTYFLVHRQRAACRVFLVEFGAAPPSARLIAIRSDSYEEGLALQSIKFSERQHSLPPWLSPLEGVNVENLEERRSSAKRTYRDYVESRLMLLQPALNHVAKIFSAADPVVEINRFARAASPKQNESRFRCWFLTYLAFGWNCWSLLPPFLLSGGKRRESNHRRKRGRPPAAGAQHGYNCTAEMVEKILLGWVKYARRGETQRQLYVYTMEDQFGCRTEKNAAGRQQYVQVDGLPFPTQHQFRYWLNKSIGREQISRTLLGEQRYRNRIHLPQGSYAQSVGYLMERVDADGYWIKAWPRSLMGDETMQKLVVVELVCWTTAMVVGIGFNLGSETSEAYRAALFCAAIGKKAFGELFGLDIDDEDWPCKGLPLEFIPDRGPGAANAVNDAIAQFVSITELPPSYTPQSHSTVEAQHPRSVRLQGAPTHLGSDADVIKLARAEIMWRVLHNKISVQTHRMTPEMLRSNVPATPLGIWNFLAQRHRSAAQPIGFDAAVRAFLTPVTFSFEDGKLKLSQIHYSSRAFREAVEDYASKRPVSRLLVEPRGYALSMCVRYVWVEFDAKLYQVEAQLPLRDDDQQLYMTLSELRHHPALLNRARREAEEERAPLVTAARQKVTAGVGPEACRTRHRQGKAKPRKPKAILEKSYFLHGRKGRPA